MKVELRDIARPLTEAIIIPANSMGIMSRGAAESVLRIAGPAIQVEAKQAAKLNGKARQPGDCFATLPHELARRGVKRVYHAITMKYPGGLSTLEFVNSAMRCALDRAITDGVRIVGVTGLGTGVGRLDKSAVARIMVPIAKNLSDKIEVRFLDRDKEFIDEIRTLID